MTLHCLPNGLAKKVITSWSLKVITVFTAVQKASTTTVYIISPTTKRVITAARYIVIAKQIAKFIAVFITRVSSS